jgi:rubredoxin-NAD+ reductase
MKYICTVCGYEYDEAKGDSDHGVPAGTKWADLPQDRTCPLCGVAKEFFAEK